MRHCGGACLGDQQNTGSGICRVCACRSGQADPGAFDEFVGCDAASAAEEVPFLEVQLRGAAAVKQHFEAVLGNAEERLQVPRRCQIGTDIDGGGAARL